MFLDCQLDILIYLGGCFFFNILVNHLSKEQIR